MNENTKIKVPPITKTLTVNLGVEDAFRLFTAGIGTWWPVHTHSVGEERVSTCKLEGRVGGRFYEIQNDGTEVLWGTVLTWDPPRRLVYSWHPGYEVEQAQEVEVTFEPDGDGSRLNLVHRGWEERVKVHPEVRDGYDMGWDIVLGKYLSQAGETK